MEVVEPSSSSELLIRDAAFLAVSGAWGPWRGGFFRFAQRPLADRASAFGAERC